MPRSSPGRPTLESSNLRLLAVICLSISLWCSVLDLGAPARASAQMMMMPLVVPLFVEDGQFTSTLVLVNGSSLNTYADVVASDLGGRDIATKRVEFSPHSQRRVQIAEILSAGGSTATTGKIEIRQSPKLKGMSIVAQLSLTHLGSGERSYIDEEVSMPSASGSRILRAVADPSDGSPVLAITSLSESEQHITIECLGGDLRFSKSVTLAAGETLITEATAEATLHMTSLEDVLGNANEVRAHEPIGISLTFDAPPGSFAAFGLAPHKRNGDQFFSAISFVDPKLLVTSTTVFAGVPVGSSNLLPEGRYVPQLALSNFSTESIRVGVKYARSFGGNSVVQEVANLTVKGRSSQALSLDKLKGDPELQNSFMVASAGAPGDLIANLISTSESGLLEVGVMGKDEKGPENGGSHPWSLEQGNESTLLLFNHTTEPLRFNVTISSDDGSWQKGYKLESTQTEAISIRNVIQNQDKDDNGRTLPHDATSGRVGWFTGGAPKGTGRVLQSNRALAMARNFSCGESVRVCDGDFVPSTATIDVGSSHAFIGYAEALGCVGFGPGCDSGDPSGVYSGNLLFWAVGHQRW